MTDLYEALRDAIAPDGRVRLTLPLLTAMREEAERRERGESADALKTAIEAAFKLGYAEADRDTLDAMGEPHGTPVHVALVLYREKFAALMRERAETAERGRGEWRERAFAAEGALAVRLAVRREIEEALGMVPGLTDDQALQRGLDAVRALLERAETAERELEGAGREADEQRERRKRAEVERDAAHVRARVAESKLDEMRADRDSWRQQCEDARGDALRYGRERDDVSGEASAISRRLATARLDLRDLIAHARACLDPEIVSRDPAHARLAALVERIEGR